MTINTMINLENCGENSSNFFWREQNLLLVKRCLLKYKETSDEEYIKWAKIFGEWSVFIKDKYLI